VNRNMIHSSAIYPSDEPDEEDNPNSIIDRIIDSIIGRGDDSTEDR